MTPTELKTLAVTALEELKGVEVTVIDVTDRTTVTDWMIVATGTSQRHVKSLANEVVTKSKEGGARPLGIEGESEGDWILVDLGDAIVHVMTRETRDFYALEKLWTMEPAGRQSEDELEHLSEDEAEHEAEEVAENETHEDEPGADVAAQ